MKNIEELEIFTVEDFLFADDDEAFYDPLDELLQQVMTGV